MGSKPKQSASPEPTPLPPVAPIVALTKDAAGADPSRRRKAGTSSGFAPVLTGSAQGLSSMPALAGKMVLGV